jgi:hypothetical protein
MCQTCYTLEGQELGVDAYDSSSQILHDRRSELLTLRYFSREFRTASSATGRKSLSMRFLYQIVVRTSLILDLP